MTSWRLVLLVVLGLCMIGPAVPAAAPGAVVTVKNTLDISRPSETVVLEGAVIRQAMAVEDLRTVHIADAASGKEVLAQPIDLNDDGKFDQVVFQVDIGPRATRTFALSVGPRQIYTKDQFKAFGRFVRERRDDFAWENDRVAHRMYGKALETWAEEPLTSSSVDVWFKRTRRLVVNDWYMVDDYHRDNGEGADLYLGRQEPRVRRQRNLGRRQALHLRELRRHEVAGKRARPRDVRADVPRVRRRRGARDRDQARDPRRGTAPQPV